MKKFAASIAVALLMSVGLVAASSTTATAARPYTPEIQTTCNATSQGSVNRNQRPKLRVAVRARGFNRAPRGTIKINYVRLNGGKRVSYQRAYTGAPIVYDFPPLRKPGRYRVAVRFTPPGTSPFFSCADSANQFVRNRPRR